MYFRGLRPVPAAVLGCALALALLALAPASQAQTADGETPSVEQVCDGLDDTGWGLCNAYCEAMDCDFEAPHASAEACQSVLEQFTKHTGGAVPGCIRNRPSPDGLDHTIGG